MRMTFMSSLITRKNIFRDADKTLIQREMRNKCSFSSSKTGHGDLAALVPLPQKLHSSCASTEVELM